MISAATWSTSFSKHTTRSSWKWNMMQRRDTHMNIGQVFGKKARTTKKREAKLWAPRGTRQSRQEERKSFIACTRTHTRSVRSFVWHYDARAEKKKWSNFSFTPPPTKYRKKTTTSSIIWQSHAQSDREIDEENGLKEESIFGPFTSSRRTRPFTAEKIWSLALNRRWLKRRQKDLVRQQGDLPWSKIAELSIVLVNQLD